MKTTEKTAVLKQRVITAVILLLLLIGATTLLGPFSFALVIALIVLLAAWEWGGLVGLAQRQAKIGFLVSIALMAAGTFFLLGVTPGAVAIDVLRVELLLILGIIFWLFVLLLLIQYPASRSRWNDPSRIAAMGLFALLPTLAGIMQLKYLASTGWLVLALVVLVAAVDIGAYFAGTYVGRRKLAPDLSPNKSWEGVWGGLGLSLLVTLICAWVVHNYFAALSLPAFLLFIGLAPVVTFFSVTGDLLESMLKRNSEVKDSGTLLPGHGGLLDRVDGLLAATPAFTLMTTLLLEVNEVLL